MSPPTVASRWYRPTMVLFLCTWHAGPSWRVRGRGWTRLLVPSVCMWSNSRRRLICSCPRSNIGSFTFFLLALAASLSRNLGTASSSSFFFQRRRVLLLVGRVVGLGGSLRNHGLPRCGTRASVAAASHHAHNYTRSHNGAPGSSAVGRRDAHEFTVLAHYLRQPRPG